MLVKRIASIEDKILTLHAPRVRVCDRCARYHNQRASLLRVRAELIAQRKAYRELEKFLKLDDLLEKLEQKEKGKIRK